jgi:type II secretory pathway pseudopilin PulG
MKKAFTLIEVNLAMLIMAGGILSIVGLYAFAFRESRQSREDVAATAIADSVISPLVCALSATNVTWSSFRSLGNYPGNNGWGDYLDRSKGVVTQNPQGKARSVFSSVTGALRYNGAYDGPTEFPSTALNGTGMSCGLVVQHEQDSAVVRISCRATKLPGALLSMPMFYTEVRFQGIPDL